jgi:hypothetical protein
MWRCAHRNQLGAAQLLWLAREEVRVLTQERPDGILVRMIGLPDDFMERFADASAMRIFVDDRAIVS